MVLRFKTTEGVSQHFLSPKMLGYLSQFGVFMQNDGNLFLNLRKNAVVCKIFKNLCKQHSSPIFLKFLENRKKNPEIYIVKNLDLNQKSVIRNHGRRQEC